MTKKHLYLNSFVSGFLYVFGLSENPVIILRSKYQQSDSKGIAEDWINVGGYFQKAIDTNVAQRNTKSNRVKFVN